MVRTAQRTASSSRFASFVRANTEPWTTDWSPERWDAEYTAVSALRAERRAAEREGRKPAGDLARQTIVGLVR